MLLKHDCEIEDIQCIEKEGGGISLSFLYEYEWLSFAISEGLTWIFIFLFLLSRYKLGFIRLSQLFLLLIIFCNLFQGVLVGIDYYFTGKISLFQIVIILFIIYASTLGRSDFQRLDQYIQEKMAKQHRTTFKGDIYAYINNRRKRFYIHSLAFFATHFVWFFIDHQFIQELPNYVSSGEILLYLVQVLPNVLSYLWSIVYLFDLSIFLIYTIWLIRNSDHKVV